MSRREYDFENGDTSLDTLMKAINTQKANFGGDSMYIELARKFDNSDYQWVIYRSTRDSNTSGTDTTTGYFVLFNKSGSVIKSISFSYKYLCHGAAQTYIEQTSSSSTNIKYGHTYLFVSTGEQVRYNYLRTYGVDIKFTQNNISALRIWIPTYSNAALKNTTSSYIGNFVTDNVFVYKGGTSSIQWHCNSNSSVQCSVCVSVSLSSGFAQTPVITTSVARTEGSLRNSCQLLYYYQYYRWITWDPNSATSTISYTTNVSSTGWNRSTTTYSPFVNTYKNVFYLPIWSWNPSGYTPDVSYFNKSLWWQTNAGPYERKYMFSTLNASPPTIESTTEPLDYYRLDNGTVNHIAFGAMTIDGCTLYTLNLESKLIEKINTKVR